MGLDGFDRLYHDADARAEPVSVAVAGGDDPTVLEAMRIACDCGWVRPILVGPEPRIRAVAEASEIDLDGFAIRHAEGDAIAAAAVAEVRSRRGPGARERADRHARADEGRARPRDRAADRAGHLPGRPDGDPPRSTGGSCWPTRASACSPSLDERIDILRSTVEVAACPGVEPAQGRAHGRDRDGQAGDARDRRGRRDLPRATGRASSATA